MLLERPAALRSQIKDMLDSIWSVDQDGITTLYNILQWYYSGFRPSMICLKRLLCIQYSAEYVQSAAL